MPVAPAWLLRQKQHGQPEAPSKLNERPKTGGPVESGQKRAYHQGKNHAWANELLLVAHEQPLAPRATELPHEHRMTKASETLETAASRASLAELYSLEHDRGHAAAHNSAAAARMQLWLGLAKNAKATTATVGRTHAWAQRQARAWIDAAVATADSRQALDSGTATAPDVGRVAAATAAAAAAAGQRDKVADSGGYDGEYGVALPIMTFTGDLVAWWACAPGGLETTDGAAVYAEVRRQTGLPANAFFIAHSRRVHAGRRAAGEPPCTCAFPPCRCGAAKVGRLRAGTSLAEQGVERDSRLVLHVDAICAVAKPRTPGTVRSGDLCVARSKPPPHRSVGMGGWDRNPWLPD